GEPVWIGQGTLPLSRGVVIGRAALDQIIIQVPDLQAETEEYPVGSENARRLGHRTILAVPLKQYSEALPHLREVVGRAPNSTGGHLWSAANYAQSGQFEEARREAAEAVRIDPTFSIERTARNQAAVCRYREESEHYLDGLRRAGLPEK